MAVPLLNPTDYPATDYFSAYGGKPTLPTPTGSATGAVTGNLGNFGGIYNLGLEHASAGAAAAQKPFLANLPNYAEMTKQSSQNILSELAGDVPQDVWTQIQQRGAERGISMGMPGAQANNSALLRALGLTSLNLMQQGEQNLTGAMGRTPRGPLFDPASMFVTPEQQQQAGVAQAIYAAAPNPAHAAAAKRNEVRSGIQAGMRSGGGGGGGASWTPPAPGLQSPNYANPDWSYGTGDLGLTYGGVVGEAPQTFWDTWTGSNPAPSGTQDDWSGYTLDDFFGEGDYGNDYSGELSGQTSSPDMTTAPYDPSQDVMSWGLYE